VRPPADDALPTKGPTLMLDVIYLLLGAVFLSACVLYAYTCDRL
jgi:hypothetical protein